MISLKIYEDSTNYTCQVIKLPAMQKVEGLDNLVSVNVQGNDCLIGKDSNPDELYLFFPVECQLSHDFVAANNLYRHNDYNVDKTKKGFFEDNRRVKALKFKGIVSTGFVIPVVSIRAMIEVTAPAGATVLHKNWKTIADCLKLGDEFNEIEGVKICQKYFKQGLKASLGKGPKTRIIDEIVDSKFAPEHLDTGHLLKNVHKLKLNDYIAVTYKLHGTSARYYNTLVRRKLSVIDRISKFFGAKIQKEDYEYLAASRRVVKSVGFEELPFKQHYFVTGDLWSEVGKEYFEGKLHQGEAVYCEIIGKTYKGEAIQSGYTYGLEKPKVYIYRISNINPQGIEVDLTQAQLVERSRQLGVEFCPVFFYGQLGDLIKQWGGQIPSDRSISLDEAIGRIFYNCLLEKPSILDSSVVEEGFCIRVDKYPRPEIFKIKSKAFLIHEGHQVDKEVVNIEDEQTVTQ